MSNINVDTPWLWSWSFKFTSFSFNIFIQGLESPINYFKLLKMMDDELKYPAVAKQLLTQLRHIDRFGSFSPKPQKILHLLDCRQAAVRPCFFVFQPLYLEFTFIHCGSAPKALFWPMQNSYSVSMMCSCPKKTHIFECQPHQIQVTAWLTEMCALTKASKKTYRPNSLPNVPPATL